jgi:Tfp pilus assembly protein PilO
MNPIDKLRSLPIVNIAVPFLVLFLAGYFVLLPAIKQYAALSQRIKNKELDLALVQSSNAQYAALKDDIENKESQVAQIKNRLFWEKDISKFLNELTRLASDLQIEFVSLRPEASGVPLEKDKGAKDREQKDFVLTKVPIEVTFRTSYNGIIDFLKRIEEGQKFIKIDTLAIESQANDIYKHNVKMRLSILIEKGA